MDKLDNETWEDYALKHNLFKIKYKNDIIEDIELPNTDKLWSGLFPDFITIIMDELYTLSTIYRLSKYNSLIQKEAKATQEDVERQVWLLNQLHFWRKKDETDWEIRHETYINKYLKIQKIISENNPEQLDYDLLSIIPHDPPNNLSDYAYSQEVTPQRNYINLHKHKRIELYNKYMKKKEIQTQINEMEEKVKQLKKELEN